MVQPGAALLTRRSVGGIEGLPTTRCSPREGSTAQLLRDFNTSGCTRSQTDSSVRTATSATKTVRRGEVLLDANLLADGSGLRRARPDPGQPGRPAAGLLGGHRRRRGLPAAASATWTAARTWPTRCRAATTAAPGAPTRTHFFYTVHDEAYRPHEVRRHALGTPPDEDVVGARRAGRAVRAQRCGPPAAAARADALAGQPRHQRGLGARRRRDRPRRRGRSAGAVRASSTTPSTRCCPTAGTRCCWSPTTTRPSSGWPAARCRRAGDQDHTAWTPVLRRGPGRAAGAGRRVRRARRAQPAHRGRAPAAGAAARRSSSSPGPGRAPGSRSGPRSTAGRSQLGPNAGLRGDRVVTVADQSYVQPPVWSDVDLATGAAHASGTASRHRATTPTGYVCERRTFPRRTAPRCR